MSDPFVLEKRQVRRAFDRAAESYDAAAALQHEVAGRMLERLSLFRVRPQAVLDAGSGTGQATIALSGKYPRANIVELDLSHAMLRLSRRRQPHWLRWLPFYNRRRHVCADLERMPLQGAGVDLIWSNLALQWSNDLAAAFAEMKRVLRPGGLLTFTTFGPDTLRELREAFVSAGPAVHVNRFVDMHDIGDLLIHAGFADPVMDMEYFTVTYATVLDLMRELKSIGAHNVNVGRNRGLTGRAALAGAVARYEQLRDGQGRLPATFEVIYGHAWKPAQRKGPGGRPVIELQVAGRD